METAWLSSEIDRLIWAKMKPQIQNVTDTRKRRSDPVCTCFNFPPIFSFSFTYIFFSCWLHNINKIAPHEKSKPAPCHCDKLQASPARVVWAPHVKSKLAPCHYDKLQASPAQVVLIWKRAPHEKSKPAPCHYDKLWASPARVVATCEHPTWSPSPPHVIETSCKLVQHELWRSVNTHEPKSNDKLQASPARAGLTNPQPQGHQTWWQTSSRKTVT